ncbi:rRNA pseudouridine synthase [Candidatus Saccharibacteria bacterium]|nr:rRNA pseudouridine synthase [Candidatus Saccharibacteria bacterium]
MATNETVRLNKFLAERVGLSRREADDLIAAGQILVNDSLAVLGARIDKNDKVCYNGSIIPFDAGYSYLMLNKPAGYVSSRRAQGDAPTLYELLPEKYRALKTVGRLDKDSSGLILLTNDGDFAYQMTHPKFVKVKEYEVRLDRALEPLHQQMVADFGIDLPDGKSQLGLTRLADDRKHWLVTMSEGRNRQIRRTFAAVGYEVVRLHRIAFGPYKLGNLKDGEYKAVERI